MTREIENSISLSDKKTLLTDFQKQFFDVLTNENFFSVSAPTSAGKSFIFTLSIIKRFLKNKKEKIVLVVPTRALIKELSEKVLNGLKEYSLTNEISIRTVPLVEEDNIDNGIVYILTQERLNTLINETDIIINTLFIDEAQEIQSNRGVVLQNTLELAIKKFPDINLFFASPLINNPKYFNELLNLDYEDNHFTENISPVGQNIIFLSLCFIAVDYSRWYFILFTSVVYFYFMFSKELETNFPSLPYEINFLKINNSTFLFLSFILYLIISIPFSGWEFNQYFNSHLYFKIKAILLNI